MAATQNENRRCSADFHEYSHGNKRHAVPDNFLTLEVTHVDVSLLDYALEEFCRCALHASQYPCAESALDRQSSKHAR